MTGCKKGIGFPKEIFRSANRLSESGAHSRYIIREGCGVLILEFESLFGDGYTAFYSNFPDIPDDFSKPAPPPFMTEGGRFIWKLTSNGRYRPSKKVISVK